MGDYNTVVKDKRRTKVGHILTRTKTTAPMMTLVRIPAIDVIIDARPRFCAPAGSDTAVLLAIATDKYKYNNTTRNEDIHCFALPKERVVLPDFDSLCSNDWAGLLAELYSYFR